MKQTILLFVALAVLITVGSAMKVTTITMEKLTEPTYLSPNGHLHLNTSMFGWGYPDHNGIQTFGFFENKTLIGKIERVDIDRSEVTYERIDGKTVTKGGDPMGYYFFTEHENHQGMEKIEVTNESLTVYVSKESSEKYPNLHYNEGDLMLESENGLVQGFAITWLASPDSLVRAFVLPQYVDYVLNHLEIGGPEDASFSG